MIQSISGMGGGMMGMHGAQGRPNAQEAFNKIDSDGDGVVSAVEFQAVSDKMAEKMGGNGPSVEEMMSQFDGDGDGALSFAEFEALRPQGPPPGGPRGMGMGGGYGKTNQMDLSSLFGESEDESESEDENIFAYA